MPRSAKGQVPTYLKVLIAFGVIVFLGTIVMAVIGFRILQENISPGHAAKIAREIVDLPDPLPEGWEYGAGLDVGYSKVVNVVKRSGTNHPMIQFMELTISGRRSAKDMASKFSLPSTAGMKFESGAQGEEKIGGQTAYYVRGHFSILGRESASEVALIDLPDGKILQVQSTEQGETTFDPEQVKPLLDSVKGFHGSGH